MTTLSTLDSPTRRLLLILTSLMLCLTAAGCGGSSTDTGNPPFVDVDQIRVLRGEDGVVVLGDPGAVDAGAGVEVTNVASGDSGSTTAGGDGSFEVAVSGSTTDDYRVVVTSGGASKTVTVGPRSGGDPGAALMDRQFLLDQAEGYTPVADTTISVSFADSGFGFSAGCNSYFAEFQLCDGKLCTFGFGSTEMGCDAERHAQDEWLAAFFGSEPELVLEGDRLTFIGADATLVFLDREVANPDRPLTGSLWTVDTIIDGGAASSVPPGEPATLAFADDGTLAVFDGCNSVQYTYEVTGQTLSLTLVGSTRVACMGAIGELAGHMSQVLTGTASFEIDAQRLTIMNGSLGVGATTP